VGGRVDTKKGGIMVDCFVSTYENRRMKPVVIVLRRGGGGRGRRMKG
jgi:hypothetical protein